MCTHGGRPPAPTALLLRSPCPLRSHVNALMLAHALGVDAVLVPPAWSRNPGDFNHSKFDQQWVKNNPASTLLDLESMAAAWAQRGIQLVEVGVGAGNRW